MCQEGEKGQIYALLRIQLHDGFLCRDKVVPQTGAKVMVQGPHVFMYVFLDLVRITLTTLASMGEGVAGC